MISVLSRQSCGLRWQRAKVRPQERKRATRLLFTRAKLRTYFFFARQHMYIPVSQNMSTYPRVTRTTCGLVRGLTRTRDALTRAGTGRPLKFLVPAGWVRV
ncbi:hypothetical protein BDR03DRAFT_969046 [Suillus americanus]|nr:hypothetical protein BDR03DRAFT_969046 [Suillus americanus]